LEKWEMLKRRTGLGIRSAIAAGIVFASVATPSIANSVAYGYDADGRLASALYDSGMCIAYRYDENGNRTSQTPLTAPTSPTWGSASWGCFRWTAS
jgi:YD repeat-containing protein